MPKRRHRWHLQVLLLLLRRLLLYLLLPQLLLLQGCSNRSNSSCCACAASCGRRAGLAAIPATLPLLPLLRRPPVSVAAAPAAPLPCPAGTPAITVTLFRAVALVVPL